MPCNHTHTKLNNNNSDIYVNARRYDPTHTTTLRNNFSSQMRKRFRKLRGLIRTAIVDEDVFALKEENEGFSVQKLEDMSTPTNDFNFSRSADKVQAFMDWLNDQVEKGVLDVQRMERLGQSAEQAWTSTYIRRAYEQGVKRSTEELNRAGYSVPSIEAQGGMSVVMQQPYHVDRVGLLYTRAFNDLKGITNDMDTQLSRILSRGMAQGKNPYEIARELTRTIKGPVGNLALTDELGRFIPAERRAEMLARTEVIRAHHSATMQTYKNWQAEGVRVRAEFQTAGDDRVCPECIGLQGQVFSIEEAENIIPVHPLCYDDETEVYTDEGWKLFRNLNGNEKIFSMNPENLEVDFLDYNHIVSYEYEGKMYHLDGKSVDLMITPDHKQIIGTRSNSEDRSEITWKMEKIKDAAERYEFRMPKTGNWNGADKDYININGINIKTEIFAKFMGYYLSEGSIVKKYNDFYEINIHQQEPNKTKMYNDIKNMPVNVNDSNSEKIYIYSQDLSKYLLKFGHSEEKYIPKEIKELDSKYIRIFLDAYLLGDGCEVDCNWSNDKKDFKSVKKEITTSSPEMAGDIGELIIKVGDYPTYSFKNTKGNEQKFSNGTYTINGNSYTIRWNRSNTAIYTKRNNLNINEVNYSGIVYDVELSKWHVLLVRRNGKTLWSGNCRCVMLPVTPEAMKAEGES